MVYLGAKGNTAKQLEDTLKISFLKNQVHCAYREYLSLLQSDNKNFTLKSANRIYANQKLPVSNDYKTRLTQAYLSTIESVDFDQKAAETKDAINKWVEQYTNGKIKNLIPDNALTPETLLVLINAIYFKGSWAKKFPERATRKRDFFLNSNQIVKRETMHVTEKFYFKHEANLGCKILEIPYIENDLSMFVILPDNRNGLGLLEQRLDPKFFHSLVQRKGFSKIKMEVFLPKFRLETKYELNNILSKMGLTDLFDAAKSDLSGMVSYDMWLYVSQVIHKAFIEVNEEGTEAAAVTGGIIGITSIIKYPKFQVDHPFLFCIVDNRMKIILFLGRINDPEI